MWLYPFKHHYLRSELNRAQIQQKVLEFTFLSDEGYRRTDENPRYFFGTASDQEFSLQTIQNHKNLVPYVEGEIKGVENEIYLFLQLKAWRYRRVFLLLIIFVLICLVVFSNEIFNNGMAAFQSMTFMMLSFILGGCILYLLWVCFVFWR